MNRVELGIFADTEFCSKLLRIAVPISIQTLVQAALGLVDQVMVGQLGEASIAAVGLGNRPGFILLFVLAAMAGAAGVYFSQYWGSGDTGAYSKPATITLWSSLGIGVLFAFLSQILSAEMLGLFSSDPSVVSIGAEYLRITSWSFFSLVVSIFWSTVLRSSGIAKFPMYLGIATVALNTLLNYLLIFGYGIFPEMGTAGAAWATVISRSVEAGIIVVVVYTKKWPGAFSLGQLNDWDLTFFRKFFVTAFPLLATDFLWVMGDTAFAAVYGRMGTEALAAITMTFPLQALTIGLFVGLSSAAGILLGHRLGADEREGAIDWGRNILLLGVLTAGCVSILVALTAGFYVQMFEVDGSVLNVTKALVIVFALYLPIKVLNMICGNGVLRSGGDTAFVFFSDLIGMWGIGIPIAVVSAFVLDLSVLWVYALLSVEEIVRALGLLWRFASKKWANNLIGNEVNALHSSSAT